MLTERTPLRGHDGTEASGRPVRLHRFALLSGIGWLIDFAIFNLLVALGVGLFAANAIGATCGVSFVFVTGRRYIFRDVRTGMAAAILAYAVWNLLAITAMSWAIAGLGELLAALLPTLLRALALSDPRLAAVLHALVAPAAKIALTPVSMYANFVAMGLIVERRLHFV